MYKSKDDENITRTMQDRSDMYMDRKMEQKRSGIYMDRVDGKLPKDRVGIHYDRMGKK
jgi:hypothetical protein